MAKDRLVEVFGSEGRQFAGALRRLLPVIVGGTQAEIGSAQIELHRLANEASEAMKLAAGTYVRTQIPAYVVSGGRAAANDLGLVFGGPNIQLIQKLALEAAGPLAEAAGSPRRFLGDALTKATATRSLVPETIKLTGGRGEMVVYNKNKFLNSEKINDSVLRSAVFGEAKYAAIKRLMDDLGLSKGDRILLLSGRTYDAEAYAELTVRTREMEATNLAKAAEYVSKGYQFIETSDHDVEDPDDICAFLQGKVWALVPNDLGIPMLPEEYGLPPWHPNCSHTFGAWIPTLNGGQEGVDSVLASHEDDQKALQAWDGKTKK